MDLTVHLPANFVPGKCTEVLKRIKKDDTLFALMLVSSALDMKEMTGG